MPEISVIINNAYTNVVIMPIRALLLVFGNTAFVAGLASFNVWLSYNSYLKFFKKFSILPFICALMNYSIVLLNGKKRPYFQKSDKKVTERPVAGNGMLLLEKMFMMDKSQPLQSGIFHLHGYSCFLDKKSICQRKSPFIFYALLSRLYS